MARHGWDNLSLLMHFLSVVVRREFILSYNSHNKGQFIINIMDYGSDSNITESYPLSYPHMSTCSGYDACGAPYTGFKTYGAEQVPDPPNCYSGPYHSRYEHLGNYVPSAVYTSQCLSEDCNVGLSARSQCKKIARPASDYGYGKSSTELMYPGPGEPQSCAPYSVYNACSGMAIGTGDVCTSTEYCNAFEDTIIDEPRDLAWVDNLRGDYTFVTSNFNQSIDPRGDIAVGPGCPPPGASLSTHGVYHVGKPWRGYVY